MSSPAPFALEVDQVLLVTQVNEALVAAPLESRRLSTVPLVPTALFQFPSCPRPAFPVTIPSPAPPPVPGAFWFPPAILTLITSWADATGINPSKKTLRTFLSFIA